jgi:ribitol-5-phosphate 2-dehydrogenase (NADP+) / D-ribitol-5-phosphate cytidylyltransferase
MNTKTTAIILAGGSGARMKGDIPKQFLPLMDKPMILYSLEAFERSDKIADIVLVCKKENIPQLKKIVKTSDARKVRKIVAGGKTRQASSYNGLKACAKDTESVLIHDAARPFIGEGIINRTVKALTVALAVTTAIDTSDTVLEISAGYIKKIPDRKKLKRVQTPQGFKYDVILNAHKEAFKLKESDFTDDCGLLMARGDKVKVVKGSVTNIKITNKEDMLHGQNILKHRGVRI